MRVVSLKSEILKNKILQARALGVEQHLGQRAAFAGELEPRLLDVVCVEVQVAESVNKGSRFESADLRDHEGQEGIGGDIERNTQEQIRAALVKLAAEFAILHIELEERMARREGHEMQLGGIPCRNDKSAAVRIFFDILHHAGDLIDNSAIRSLPVAPLGAIDPTEIAVFIRPLVPDRDIVLAQVGNVCLALQEPQQLVNNRTQVEFFVVRRGKPCRKSKRSCAPKTE
jgi:hypothetical protein